MEPLSCGRNEVRGRSNQHWHRDSLLASLSGSFINLDFVVLTPLEAREAKASEEDVVDLNAICPQSDIAKTLLMRSIFMIAFC
jgi:hypothetical protein